MISIASHSTPRTKKTSKKSATVRSWARLAQVQERRNAFAHGQPQAIDDALVQAVVEKLKVEHDSWIAVFNKTSDPAALIEIARMANDILVCCNCMDRVRHHVSIADSVFDGKIDAGHRDLNAELIFLHFRKALEEIAFASLSANRERYSAARAGFPNEWNARRMLGSIDKVNPNFYPIPLKQPREIEWRITSSRWSDATSREPQIGKAIGQPLRSNFDDYKKAQHFD